MKVLSHQGYHQIAGEQLARYMVEYDIGVSTSESYSLKKIDEDYFEE